MLSGCSRNRNASGEEWAAFANLLRREGAAKRPLGCARRSEVRSWKQRSTSARSASIGLFPEQSAYSPTFTARGAVSADKAVATKDSVRLCDGRDGNRSDPAGLGRRWRLDGANGSARGRRVSDHLVRQWGEAHPLRIVSQRDLPRSTPTLLLSQPDVVAQFQTCLTADGSLDRILDAVQA